MAKDKDGWTLLHHACYKGWLQVVKHLVSNFGADPHLMNNYHCTPLHWAAFGGHYNIVRYLVLDLNCDPHVENKRGNTPLQIATWRGHLDVFKFFVLDCKCDPLKANKVGLTPLYEAFVCNHVHIISFLLSTGKIDGILSKIHLPKLLSDWYWQLFHNIIDFRKTNPLKPRLKVFVLGDIGVGKTTLVSAIQNKICSSKLNSLGAKYRKVPEAIPHTKGVNSIHLHGMVLFDFAGHQEFYSSHAALLENLESSRGNVLVILLDLTLSKSELKHSLESWMSFIDSIYSDNRPPSIVIGSHSDKLTDKQTDSKAYLQSICDSANLRKWDTNSMMLAMNCTKRSSNELSSLLDKLHEHLHTYHKTFNVDTQTHILSAIIREYSKNIDACQIHEIIKHLEDQNEGLFECNILPRISNEQALHQSISVLSDLGEFVYLRSETFKDGWIVFNKHILFTEVNGAIFAPETFCSCHNISNSTGLISEHKLAAIFQDHNIDMIISFLTYFKYCYKIPENICFGSDQLYFFPQLVNQSKADLVYFKDCSYTSKWQLKCSKSYQCFTTRFTQTIVVQLAGLFGLSPEISEQECSCPVIFKECNVWNLGIHWKDMDGVEVIVEFSNSYKHVLLSMGCQKGDELHLVKLRSSIISTIMQIKDYSSKGIETSESFVYPPQSECSFEYSKDHIYLAAKLDKRYVTAKSGRVIEQLPLNTLLYMEPLALIPYDTVKQLFCQTSPNTLLSLDLLNTLTTTSKEDKSGFIASALKRNMTCGQWKDYIIRYSIFSEQTVRDL